MSDLIDRQEAIDALRTHERKASKKWFDNQLDIEWNNAIDICCYDIEDLPSAQPSGPDNLAKDSQGLAKDLVNDCVSRRMAIDALNKMKIYRPLDSDRYVISDCLNKIVNLPSAQPERQKGEWLDYTEDGYVECPFCHNATNCDGNKDELHFCFSCGADMREVDE